MVRVSVMMVALWWIGLRVDGSVEPRYQRDDRCVDSVRYDAAGSVREASFSRYLEVSSTTLEDCATKCCGDWSCIAFVFNGTHCGFNDDVDALVPSSDATVRSGTRSHLSSRPPPGEASSWTAAVDPEFVIGINGDEFPITWGADGAQYTGAGDNHQPGDSESPLAFFKVSGAVEDLGCHKVPTKHNQPSPSCDHIKRVGVAVPINGSKAQRLCHGGWEKKPIANLKSSGVLSVDGVLYWAVSCFNYGDDPVFNRQRYGPARIGVLPTRPPYSSGRSKPT